jgi:5-methylcytosine-specific restriction endonuclease McrA
MEPLKLCKKCGIEKPLTVEFWKPNKSTKSGWYLTMCRECFNAYCRDYCKNNPEWRREKERKYKENNPEKAAAKLKRHHEKQRILGKNKYCNRNQERDRQRAREERKHSDRQANKEKKRKLLKLNAKGFHTRNAFYEKLEYYGNRCYYCNKPLTRMTATEDHRIPLSKSGTDWLSNIVPACGSCNSRKRDKTETEYKNWLLEQQGIVQMCQGGG